MEEQIRFVFNVKKPLTHRFPADRFGPAAAEKARAFHRSLPGYTPTPLADLRNLASRLGVASIHVKDESFRFGLNAFKVLGGSYSVARYIADRLGEDLSDLPFARLTGPEVRQKLGEQTFVTATDGNHGRGIAWTANRLGQKSVVYMPAGSAPERLNNIRALGSDASITDLAYDDAVRLAKAHAEQYGWVLVQDTAWPGYEEIPTWIMQGYTTMADEAVEQLNGQRPTHIFLQAGVGSMAAAIAGYFAARYGETCPVITIVEPTKADCFYRTAAASDGTLHFAEGPMDTIMAGLACGEPCTLAWDLLGDLADCFAAIPDPVAAKGMRILANPLPGDPRVISGESGASTLGFVAELLTNDALVGLRRDIGLNETSRILCFSTEGDTDQENYRRILWDGLYPSF